jgi:hypothetical protein
MRVETHIDKTQKREKSYGVFQSILPEKKGYPSSHGLSSQRYQQSNSFY